MRRFSSPFRLAPTTLAFVVSSLRKISLSFIFLTLVACVAVALIVMFYWMPSSHAEVNPPLPAVRKVAPDFRPAIRLNQGGQKIAPSVRSMTKALSVAAGDLDNDAAPDLITGYGTTRGTGSVAVQRGNPDAYAPKGDAMLQRIQQGYDPPSFLPGIKTYKLNERIDILEVADLTGDGNLDVLAGSTGGGLYILTGSSTADLAAPQRVKLPGNLAGVAIGEFGEPDGNPDVAVGVNGPGGAQVLIFAGASGGLRGTPASVAVPADVHDLAFSRLDGDKFSDLVFVSGTSVEVVHGQATLSENMVPEAVKLPFAVESMSVGDFLSDRKTISEITVLTTDGTLQLLRRSDLDTRPYTAEEQTERLRNRLSTRREPEAPVSSQPVEWMLAGQIDSGISPAAKLHAAHVSAASTEDLFILGDSAKGSRMMISDFTDKGTSQLPDGSLAISRSGFVMLSGSTPTAMVSFRQKVNGNRDLVVIDPKQDSVSIVPLAATSITVDRTDDPASPAAACTGAANDCSLRGAIQFANQAGNIPATIHLPSNTYQLTIDGSAEGGLCASPNTGDLDLSGDGTTILGAGAGSTFIKGTTPNDRVMCVDAPLLGSFDFTMSGVTISGGRDTSGVGAGGIVTGGANDVSTLNAVVLTNNRTQGGGSPVGGGYGNGRGSATVTNSTIGGTVTFAACANQAAVNCGNQSQGSGAGIYMDVNVDISKTFVLSNSVVQNNNTTGGNGAGLITSSNSGSYATKSVTNTSFLSNTAPGAGAQGGGTFNESGGTMTINGSTYVSNSAAGFGGAVASPAGGNHNVNINFARFVANTSGAGNTLRGGSGSVMTATDCWWASNTGPTANAISKDNAGDVVVPSYLVLRASASPSSILLNQTSTITANFLTDSNNAAVAASNLFSLAGIGVTWSNPQKGTLSNQVNAIRTVVNITSVSESGSTVTVTTSTNHGFSNGQTVTIRGVIVPGYDGIFTITAVTANTFTYINTTTGLVSSSGGTATVPLGDATATYTSGSVSASCGNGSVDVAVDGVTVTASIINQCPDLTVAKTNNVSGSAVVGQTWTWTQTITNASGVAAAAANFTNGQVILGDNLPNSNITYSVTTGTINLSAPNSGTVNCAIDGNKDLSCTASGAVTVGVGGSFQVQFTAKADVIGTYANPRAGGSSSIDPNSVIVESNEGNNTSSNSVTVNKAATMTTITNAAGLNSTPTVVGESYAVSWSVTVNAPGSLGAALTGNVTVSDGSANCTAAVGAGTCNITSTTAGAKNIVATYAGDLNYLGGASANAPHAVNKADTTATINSDSPDPSVVGQSYAVGASVAINAPGAGTPTGSISVSDGTGATCTITLPATSCNLTGTTAGAKTLTATYNGDANYNASPTSSGAPHTVNKADTTAAVTGDSPDPSTPGQVVTVTYSVSVTSPGAGAPTGNVLVSDGVDSCTGTVAVAQCDITLNTVGNRTLTATYQGDADFNASPTSTGAPHTVSKINTTTSVTSSKNPSSVGDSVTFTATVMPASGATVPTGTVQFKDNGNNIGAPVTLVNGVASVQTNALTAGTHTITADYSGDTTFNTSSGTLAGGQLVTTPTAPGDILITEFRLRGPNPNGAQNEFIELYNNTANAITVGATDASDGYGVAASDGVLRCTIPNGTVIPARGHFLCVNSVGYSLGNYPSGNMAGAPGSPKSKRKMLKGLTESATVGEEQSDAAGATDTNDATDATAQAIITPTVVTATADATYTTDIPDNAGIALFSSTTTFTLANRLDAVGSTSEPNTLYKEGTGYPDLTPFSIDYSFTRDLCGKGGSITALGPCPTGGFPKDTDNNAADFIFVDTNGTSAGAGRRLGTPGPENLASPIQRNGSFPGPNIDTTVGASSPPNRVRDFTSDPANNSTFGTLELRKRIVNSTGGAVTRLRFRIIDLTTFPAPSGFADLRPRTTSLVVVSGINDAGTCLASNGVATTPCTINVQGTTLEQPPSQLNGGGFNSTLSAGTITLGTPLANGASINVRFLLGIQQTGAFKFFINVEALP